MPSEPAGEGCSVGSAVDDGDLSMWPLHQDAVSWERREKQMHPAIAPAGPPQTRTDDQHKSAAHEPEPQGQRAEPKTAHSDLAAQSDRLDLDTHIARQPGYLDGRARGRLRAEILGVDRIDGREIVHIR